MAQPPLRVLLLGAGSIARTVAQAVADGELAEVKVAAVVGGSTPPSQRTQDTAALVEAPVTSLEAGLALGVDWVLEAAGGAALRAHLPALVASPVGVVVMSIGALLDPAVEGQVAAKRAAGSRVVLPSGSIGGLDAVSALNALGHLESVSITTAKAPAGLATAPYVVNSGMQLSQTEAQVLFEGSAVDAVQAFPSNVNVAAALSLAGVGGERTRVTVVSDPSLTRTRHTIEAAGSSGRVSVQVESSPNPLNPGSSYLSALSAIAHLRQLAAEVR